MRAKTGRAISGHRKSGAGVGLATACAAQMLGGRQRKKKSSFLTILMRPFIY